jgi:phage/plasmid-like protein (TIGR03299 family)
MAHNLARRLDGTYMALYVGHPAWHNLGDIAEELQTAKQIYVKVFDGRIIEAVPAYAKIGKKIIEIPNFRAIADPKTGVVYTYSSPDYTPIQDFDGLKVLEAIVKASKKGIFASAGALGNGSRGFASIDLTKVLPKECLAIKGDPSAMQAFLFGTWAHDGTGALAIGRWRNRVDCNNMLDAAMADAQRAGRLVRIVHTGSKDSMSERLHEAERILGFVEEDFRANAEVLNTLNAIRIPKFPAWLAGFTELLVPIPETMERKGSREQERALIAEITLNSKNMVGVPADTAYRAYQGVAEYADHYRNIRVSAENAKVVPERRFRSITEGPAAELKARALDLIRQEFEVPVPVRVR